MIVPKININGSFQPDLSGINPDLWLVKSSMLNPDQETYTIELEWVGTVPFKIQTFQGKLLLKKLGLLETIDAMIKQAGQEEEIYWEYATEWERTSPIIARLAPMIGWGESELDDFFTNAALIK